MRQRAAQSEHLEAAVRDLQHKLAASSAELAQAAVRAASLQSKEAFLEHELEGTRARAQELMGECQALETDAARARKEHSALKREAAEAEALLAREKEQTKELEERAAGAAAAAAAAASEAQKQLEELVLRHSREFKSLLAREELLRNLIVHAEAQIDRLSAELYGDDYQPSALLPSDLALPPRSSPLTSGSETPAQADDEVAAAARRPSSPKLAASARAGLGGLRAWHVSDLVDRLCKLEEALVDVHKVLTPRSAQKLRATTSGSSRDGEGGGGGGGSVGGTGGFSSEREEWVLSERGATAVVAAAELTGFRHKVTLLQEELDDASRKLAAKDALRTKNLVAEERIQVLSRQLLAVTEERQELRRSYRVLCSKFARSSAAARRDARDTPPRRASASRGARAGMQSTQGRMMRAYSHSSASPFSDSDERAQQDAALSESGATAGRRRSKSGARWRSARSRRAGSGQSADEASSPGSDGESESGQSAGTSGQDSALDMDALHVSGRTANCPAHPIHVQRSDESAVGHRVARDAGRILAQRSGRGPERGHSLPSRPDAAVRERRRGRGVASEQASVLVVLAKGRALLDREMLLQEDYARETGPGLSRRDDHHDHVAR